MVAADVVAQKHGSKMLLEHVHLPKSAGTTVSNMLAAVTCKRTTEIDSLEFDHRCSYSCSNANVVLDTELACLNEDGGRVEHRLFDDQKAHAVNLKKIHHQIGTIVYTTTLREGTDRAISNWAHCMNEIKFHGPEQSQNRRNLCGIEYSALTSTLSDETLRHWIRTYAHGDGGAHDQGYLWFRASNMQVGMLASVPKGEPVTREHLEEAKTLLSSGQWLVGVYDCLPAYFKHIAKLVRLDLDSSHTPYSPPDTMHRTAEIMLSNDVLAEVREANSLDNELYEWASQMGLHGIIMPTQDYTGMPTLESMAGTAVLRSGSTPQSLPEKQTLEAAIATCGMRTAGTEAYARPSLRMSDRRVEMWNASGTSDALPSVSLDMNKTLVVLDDIL
jgi:hypothetical protein